MRSCNVLVWPLLVVSGLEPHWSCITSAARLLYGTSWACLTKIVSFQQAIFCISENSAASFTHYEISESSVENPDYVFKDHVGAGPWIDELVSDGYMLAWPNGSGPRSMSLTRPRAFSVVLKNWQSIHNWRGATNPLHWPLTLSSVIYENRTRREKYKARPIISNLSWC